MRPLVPRPLKTRIPRRGTPNSSGSDLCVGGPPKDPPHSFEPGSRSLRRENARLSRGRQHLDHPQRAGSLDRALSLSLTLGYGSRGNNVTSDSVSPLHLMDIKRVAFETRAVEGAAPAPINAAWEIEMAA